MGLRNDNDIRNIENRPARQLLETIKSICTENEALFKDAKRFAHSKAKTRLSALIQAYHALSIQVLGVETARPLFVIPEELINQQCQVIAETLEAERELASIASGAAIRHWEDVAFKTLLSLRNAQLEYQKRMAANTIDLFRQLRDADTVLAQKKQQLEKVMHGFTSAKKRKQAKEEVAKQIQVIEDLEVTLNEQHEHPQVKEFQSLYEQALANAEYHTVHQAEMREAASQRYAAKQLEQKKVVERITDCEMHYYGALKPDMMQKLVRLYQMYCDFQQAALPELEAKLKSAEFAEYKKTC